MKFTQDMLNTESHDSHQCPHYSYVYKKAELKRALETTELKAPLLTKVKAQRRKATFLRLHSTLMPGPGLESRSSGAQLLWSPKISAAKAAPASSELGFPAVP